MMFSAQLINQKLEQAGRTPGAIAAPAGDIEGVVVFPPELTEENIQGELQNCGIYNEPLDIDNIIRSLSHGAVWIAYNPTLPLPQVELLHNVVVQANARHGEPLVILAPESGLEPPIMATAWRVQLPLDDASDSRLADFIDQYQRGSYTPDPGPPCSGGVGQPVN